MKSSFKYSPPPTQALSWLLRHNAEKEGFVFLEGGFLPVLEVLKHKRFSPAKSLSIKPFSPGSLQTQKIQPSKVTFTFIVWSFQLEHKKSSYVLSCQQCWPNTPSQVPWRRLYLRRCWSSCGRMPKAKVFAQNNPRGESEMTKLPFLWMSHLSQGNLLIRANQGHSISTVEVTSLQLEPKIKEIQGWASRTKKQKSNPR